MLCSLTWLWPSWVDHVSWGNHPITRLYITGWIGSLILSFFAVYGQKLHNQLERLCFCGLPKIDHVLFLDSNHLLGGWQPLLLPAVCRQCRVRFTTSAAGNGKNSQALPDDRKNCGFLWSLRLTWWIFGKIYENLRYLVKTCKDPNMNPKKHIQGLQLKMKPV